MHLHSISHHNWTGSTLGLILCAATFLFAGLATGSAVNQVVSPDGKVVVQFILERGGVPAYKIEYLHQPIVLKSELGLEPAFTNGFKQVAAESTRHAGTWTNVFGELRVVPDNYNELDVDLKNAGGQDLRLTFRAYDEGAAFRYALPSPDTNEFHFTGERTEFHFPAGVYGYEEHGTEGEYQRTIIGDIRPECERPLTLEYAGGYFTSLGEAANENYPRMLLSPMPGSSNTLVGALGGTTSNTAMGRGLVRDDPSAVLHGGGSTPWRFFVVGQKPGDLLVRNYLVLDLNSPCALPDTSWIMPGKVMRETTLTTTNAFAVIDFAAVAGLQYIEFDWHWYGRDETFDTGDATTVRARNLNLPEVIRYAKEKNIGVILYVDHNQIKKQRDILFPLYEKWGVKGVKIGFVDVGPQTETAWVTETIQKAAQYHLVLDIHDGYRTTGLARTYPNLLTVEGIRGNEHMPTPTHNCTLPFTRYIAGTADYTVCYYTTRKQTTCAHQLAMAVVSYSPLQFILWYDRPSDYHGEPEIEFFKHIPTVWDETRVLNGEIGKYATIARRSGDDWFIGTINGADARQLTVPLDFLGPAKNYRANTYSDDKSNSSRTHVTVASCEVNARTLLSMSLQAAGGEAIWITPIDKK